MMQLPTWRAPRRQRRLRLAALLRTQLRLHDAHTLSSQQRNCIWRRPVHSRHALALRQPILM